MLRATKQIVFQLKKIQISASLARPLPPRVPVIVRGGGGYVQEPKAGRVVHVGLPVGGEQLGARNLDLKKQKVTWKT